MAPAIGIDLGTTYSCVGVMQFGKVEIVANEQGSYITPSYVAFNDFERLVGDAAKEQMNINATNTVFDAKRLIGRKFVDPVVQNDMKNWPFVVQNINSDPRIEIVYKDEKKLFSPEEISAMVLMKMKEYAEAHLNMPVQNAVITVPAYFNNSQRQATYDAGVIAGLNVLRIINEPTAAALAYGFNHREHCSDDSNILVFDLGGGTFDVSILSVNKGGFDVKATSGDTHLGGEDFDCRLVDYCVKEFNRKHKKDISGEKRALRRLRTACERAKRILSSALQTLIQLDQLFEGTDFSLMITRPKFEELNADLFRRTLLPVQAALSDAKLKKTDINMVVIVGGSTRIPKIQKFLQEFFGNIGLSKSINPEEAVATGAAILAATLNGDKTDRAFDVLLKDVTPLSLGIDSKISHVMTTVIKRNTTIPCVKTHKFTTVVDNQSWVNIPVIQGENHFAKDNHLLGEFRLMNIPAAPKGVPNIAITFSIDENGILKVIAEEMQTGNTGGITIQSISGHLRKDQIDRMVADARAYREEAGERKNALKARNDLENECRSIQEKIELSSSEIVKTETAEILDKCNEVLSWLEQNPHEDTKAYERCHADICFLQRKVYKKFKSE